MGGLLWEEVYRMMTPQMRCKYRRLGVMSVVWTHNIEDMPFRCRVSFHGGRYRKYLRDLGCISQRALTRGVRGVWLHISASPYSGRKRSIGGAVNYMSTEDITLLEFVDWQCQAFDVNPDEFMTRSLIIQYVPRWWMLI
jgi:hypothetical protein